VWLRLHEEDNCFDVDNECKYRCVCGCFCYCFADSASLDFGGFPFLPFGILCCFHTAFGSVSERPTRLLCDAKAESVSKLVEKKLSAPSGSGKFFFLKRTNIELTSMLGC